MYNLYLDLYTCYISIVQSCLQRHVTVHLFVVRRRLALTKVPKYAGAPLCSKPLHEGASAATRTANQQQLSSRSSGANRLTARFACWVHIKLDT